MPTIESYIVLMYFCFLSSLPPSPPATTAEFAIRVVSLLSTNTGARDRDDIPLLLGVKVVLNKLG